MFVLCVYFCVYCIVAEKHSPPIHDHKHRNISPISVLCLSFSSISSNNWHAVVCYMRSLQTWGGTHWRISSQRCTETIFSFHKKGHTQTKGAHGLTHYCKHSYTWLEADCCITYCKSPGRKESYVLLVTPWADFPWILRYLNSRIWLIWHY